MTETITPHIGIIGGSGFYSLLDDPSYLEIDTPFGRPSAPIAIGTFSGVPVAFVPRHGVNHEFPPHAINYRANMWALKEVGVMWVIAPCASGSLQSDVRIGDFVVCDQYVDRTSGRSDTFFDGPDVVHVSGADPYSPRLREALIESCRALDIRVHERGTVVVIQGPRFSTRAESKWFTQMGWEVINMTAYPEVHLAREQGLAYANICLVTDYDVGLEGSPDITPVTLDEIAATFTRNNVQMRAVLADVVPKLPRTPDPHAANALEGARI
jgi:5'-methylthioadenosine phosphorylase